MPPKDSQAEGEMAEFSFVVTDDMIEFGHELSKRLDALYEQLVRDYYKTYETWLIDGPDFAPAHEAAARRARLPSLITGEKAK
jgi:hypothetical protein